MTEVFTPFENFFIYMIQSEVETVYRHFPQPSLLNKLLLIPGEGLAGHITYSVAIPATTTKTPLFKRGTPH